MITHLVLFKFTEPSCAASAVERLLSMKGRVASLLDIEAGVDFTRSDRSYDVGLITRHKSRADLAAYQADPIHVEVAAFVRARCEKAAAVDFESED
jgi:hypothetical protein